MNRFEMARRVLLLEAAATECKRRAAEVRAGLDEQARMELVEHGVAPTWRMPDIGTVSLPISQEAIILLAEHAALPYVKLRWPEQIEERIRPAALPAITSRLSVADGRVVDEEGTVVPGFGWRPAGNPLALTFRPNRDARQVAAEAAGKLVDELAAALRLGEPNA